MIIISSRKNFTEAGKISRTLVIRNVDLLDPRPANRLLVENKDLLEKVTGKKVAILVHGFNNAFEALCRTYYEIENRLMSFKIPYDEIIGYAWPGGETVLSYFAAKKRANELKKMEGNIFIEILKKAEHVDIIAHSLGCYLVLEFIKKANLHEINNVRLMAPAIQNIKICEDNDLYSSTKRCKGIWVFRSEDDKVLGNFFKAAEGRHALGFKGPADYNKIFKTVKVVNCSNLQDPIDHNSYKTRTEIYKFISNYPNVNLISLNEIPVA